MYYAPMPAEMQPKPKDGGQHFQQSMPYVMHGHPPYSQQYTYPGQNAPVYPMQQNVMPSLMHYSETQPPLSLNASNYEQACRPVPPLTSTKSISSAAWREKMRAEAQTSASRAHRFIAETIMKSPRRNFGFMPPLPIAHSSEKTKYTRSDENAEKTDGESSYSSFYSSFFKTDSGSAEDSGDKKKVNDVKNKFWTKNNQIDDALSFQSSTETGRSYVKPRPVKKLSRRKKDAPWNEEVNVTSELVYRYQVVTKPMAEVLEADKKKMATIQQPALVNEQLGQLYLDLQLQGVAASLTLEEGISSSRSSDEDGSSKTEKKSIRKREYSRLTIIHEEDAPMPPTGSGPLAPEHVPDGDIDPIGFV